MKALLGGTLVDSTGAPPVADSVVLVDGERILRAGKSVPVPAGAEVVDAKGCWIVPGLIDAHIHFFQSGGLYTRPDILDLRARVPYREKEVVEIQERMGDTLARYLRSGVTSVVDAGGPFWNFDLRERANATDLAPRVAVAGPLISTWQPPALETGDPPILKAETPEQGRAMVRRQAERKPDLVKIWFIVDPGADPRVHLPLVSAVMDESHKRGIRVMVHATQLETARVAVEAGADVLAHSVDDAPVDDAFVGLLLDRRVLYIPTLMVLERYKRTFTKALDLTREEHALANPKVLSTLFDVGGLSEGAIPKRFLERIAREGLAPSKASMGNLKRLQDAGVRVSAGTDAGNIGTPHGPSLFRELGLMAEAGLTAEQVLTAATLGGARVMGREHELGSLEAGKLADLLVLEADPLADVRNVSRIRSVMKGGKLFDPGSIVPDAPEDVVQRQLNAYNARDIGAFAATYAPDVRIYDHPDTLRMEGRAALEERYGKQFSECPDLHASILNRTVLGRFVIDRERAAGLPGGKTADVVAVYEVAERLIRRVWFIRE